jgi:hypothetical protein
MTQNIARASASADFMPTRAARQQHTGCFESCKGLIGTQQGQHQVAWHTVSSGSTLEASLRSSRCVAC